MSMQDLSGIGMKLTKDSPTVSYLMFVDGCIIFCRTNKKAA